MTAPDPPDPPEPPEPFRDPWAAEHARLRDAARALIAELERHRLNQQGRRRRKRGER